MSDHELAEVSAEMAGAREELRVVLTTAGLYVKCRAQDDPAAAELVSRIDAAYDRLRLANALAATAVEDDRRG